MPVYRHGRCLYRYTGIPVSVYRALRMYSSTTDFAKGVAKHMHSVLYEEYVEMEAMQPYAVRRDGNAVCLHDVIALPDGQLQ